MTDNEKKFEENVEDNSEVNSETSTDEAVIEEHVDAVDDLTASEESTKEESSDMAGDVSDESGEDENNKAGKPDHPEAAIEAILFAYGNSVSAERLCETLSLTEEELEAAVENLKKSYEESGRGITITKLEDSYQLGTKAEYYDYLVRLAKHPKRYSLTDTVIETLFIIAYKQPVTRGEIERIRGVSSDHAINRLIEYELIEEVGRLDAPGKPLLFGTTEQFLRAFGVLIF